MQHIIALKLYLVGGNGMPTGMVGQAGINTECPAVPTASNHPTTQDTLCQWSSTVGTYVVGRTEGAINIE